MRLLAATLMSLLVAPALAAVRPEDDPKPLNYRIFRNGNEVAKMTWTRTRKDEDTWLERTVTTQEDEGRKVVATVDSCYDEAGWLHWDVIHVQVDGGLVLRTDIDHEFGVGNTITVQTGPEEKTVRKVPYRTKTPPFSIQRLWFWKWEPATGVEAVSQQYDDEKGVWFEMKVTYLQKGEVTLDGKQIPCRWMRTVRTYETEEETYDVALDERGDLLLRERGDQRIERVFGPESGS